MTYTSCSMLQKDNLENMYVGQRLSSAQIAAKLGCSVNKVNYWLAKYSIPKRSISDAIYTKHNPNGDPFQVASIDTLEKARLSGMGLGLYWGEGTKANKYAVRLGNSDPKLIKMFMRFLIELYQVDKTHLRFGLQVFSDLSPEASLRYWIEELDVDKSQFYKIHITPSGSLGTYRQKSKHGVLTVQSTNPEQA